MCGPLVPAVPSCILDPLREEFLALIPARVDRHPLGCHRRRIDDRVVFDKLVAGLVFGCGYERLADRSCSASRSAPNPPRRRCTWTPDMTTGPAGPSWPTEACTRRSPSAENRRPCRSANAGSSSAPTPGSTTTAGCAAAPSGDGAYLALAAALVTLRALLRAAWYRYRWDTRPRSPRIR